MIDLSYLENYKCNYNKLIAYGFKKNENFFTYSKSICNNELLFTIKICGENQVNIDVIDKALDEKLDIFYIKDTTGAFVGQINNECEKIIDDIVLKCFNKNIFKNEQTLEIIDYVSKKYGDNLEFLWQKTSNNAIWRRKDNKKWYGALLTITKNKLGLNSNENIEIIDLRTNKDTIADIIDNIKIFSGYHMNKNNWITICLNNSIATNTICKMIDISYNLAKNK